MRCPVLKIPAVAGQATPDSQVYRLFWSFDKGVAGWLLLLGLHDAPHRGRAWGGTVAAVGLLLLVLVLALAQESGMVAYAPSCRPGCCRGCLPISS
jgi:hypothetical protein